MRGTVDAVVADERQRSATLEADRLTVRFDVDKSWLSRLRGRAAELTAVDSVSFAVPHGRSVGIVGESGCGKSTVAKALVGLLAPTSGTISFAGSELGLRRNREDRRRIQMVFQDPGSSLNPSMTARQALSELLKVHGIVSGDRIDERCEELLDLVELPARFLDVRPRRLSGGQRQRIGIARALALEPEVLIADESVAALDVSVQASVLNLLNGLRRRLDLTLLFISHDLAVIRHVSDEVLVMYLGAIVESGSVERVFDAPAHPYTKALLAAAPRLRRDLPDEVPLVGEPPSPLDLPSGCRFAGRCPEAFDRCHADRPSLIDHAHGQAACWLVERR